MAEATIRGRDYQTGQPICLELAGDQILRRSELADEPNVPLPWLCPGLVDLQVNGLAGIEFTSPDLTVEQVDHACLLLARQGTTRLLPTVTTAPDATLAAALATLANASRLGAPLTRQMLAGIHLEGPFISPETGPRGAHPQQYCRTPDWELFSHWQELAEHTIRIVTLAPELDGAVEFIHRASQSGVLVALGHLHATSSEIDAAVAAGARLSTHLGNGAHSTLPRHPNYLWDQLAHHELHASLIVDGHHLPRSFVEVALRAKGLNRSLLVSDLTSLAGLAPGRYSRTSLGEVEVLDDGKLVVAGQRQYLAGASLGLWQCVENLAQLPGVSGPQAWQLASRRPLELLGLDPQDLQVGQRADLVAVQCGTLRSECAQAVPLQSAERSVSGRDWPRQRGWRVTASWVGGEPISRDDDRAVS